MAELRREIENALEELAYAAVGFTVLGIQRAQVARRQIERCDPIATVAGRLRDLIAPDGEERPPAP